MPRMVSGRFSVFSAVGLLPLALLGIDVEAVLSGARGALSLARDKGEEENGTQQSAMRLYQALQNGYDTHNLFLFHKELEGIGKWWRQLVGESLNKGGKGILPMVSIGSTDMHSMAQAYLGGPQHIFHTFVAALAESSGDTIPRERVFPELVPELSREDLNVLMRTILGGVEASFSAHGVPYDRVSLLSISPEALGNFMQTQMIETFILSRLMEVSCFDQPDVEAYKEETRQILVV